MKSVRVKRTYFQQLKPVRAPLPKVADDVSIQQVERPAVSFYRALYDGVGRDWLWVDRKMLSDDELHAIIQDPGVSIYVLHVDGELAGYAELDCRQEGEVELAYFGLFPDYIGQGLGRYFLAWVLKRAWEGKPKRVWLHTCELDHPGAPALYESSGFVQYDERVIEQPMPDDVVLPV